MTITRKRPVLAVGLFIALLMSLMVPLFLAPVVSADGAYDPPAGQTPTDTTGTGNAMPIYEPPDQTESTKSLSVFEAAVFFLLVLF